MPDDSGPIEVDGQESRLYLVETRSIGGLSGSPVFIRPSLRLIDTDPERQQPERTWRPLAGSLNFYLLGIMRGHWDLPPLPTSATRAESVNMGIGMVTPIEAALPLINCEAETF